MTPFIFGDNNLKSISSRFLCKIILSSQICAVAIHDNQNDFFCWQVLANGNISKHTIYFWRPQSCRKVRTIIDATSEPGLVIQYVFISENIPYALGVRIGHESFLLILLVIVSVNLSVFELWWIKCFQIKWLIFFSKLIIL